MEVFLERLSDKSISKAVSLRSPETIDQAFKLAKSVEKETEPRINQLAGSKENLSENFDSCKSKWLIQLNEKRIEKPKYFLNKAAFSKKVKVSTTLIILKV